MKTIHKVPSLGALLFIAVSAANCGAPSPNPGTDRGDVGPTADASEADRADPPQDRPPVQPDARVDTDAAADAPAAPDVPRPPEDQGSAMCAVATAPAPGMRCVPRLPTDMPREAFMCHSTCGVNLNVYVGVTRMEAQIGCDEDDAHRITYATLTGITSMLAGSYPCTDRMCIRYLGPTQHTIGLVWDEVCLGAYVYEWDPGIIPTATNGRRMADMPRVSVAGGGR